MKAITTYINMKHINKYIIEKLKISKNQKVEYTLFPKTKEELIEIIKDEINRNGNDCSLNHINVSKIIDMKELFAPEKYHGFGLHEFNGNISGWDVSNVKDMSYMFYASEFNNDISNWDVSNVENMAGMFKNSKFNQDISAWDVSNVEDMTSMFAYSDFDGDLSEWDVSNVHNMGAMFYEAKYTGKNGSISNWDISNVKNMKIMFKDSDFNGDISSWTIDRNFCDCSFIFIGCNIQEEFKPKSLQK